MPMQITQPSNQIRLTNVSLVRLKKGKKRFEIACYKNKVLEYRSGLETNLDEVLQIPNVFLNVSKGQTAPTADLAKAFGKDKSVDDIVLEILQKGELQVGEKERAAQLERVQTEVIDIVAGKLVDPTSKRVYTTGMISKALDQLTAQSAHLKQDEAEAQRHAHRDQKDKELKDKEAGVGGASEGEGEEEQEQQHEVPQGKKPGKALWTGVVAAKSAKSQALEAMKALIAWQPIPVARARMRLRVSCPASMLKQVAKVGAKISTPAGEENSKGGGGAGSGGTIKDRVLGFIEEVESQGEAGGDWEVVGFVEPGAFKGLNDFIGSETKGKGKIEVLDIAVVHEEG